MVSTRTLLPGSPARTTLRRFDFGACSKPYAVAMVIAMTVSELGREVGISADAIRYYERSKLLPEPSRTAAGYRLYGAEAADRLRFIKGAQRLGLRLREIRELLDVLDRGLCPCGHTEALLRQRIGEIESELSQLRDLKRQLTRFVERFPAEACDGGGWRCEVEFIRAGKEAADG
jgi:DNA-binding transcriptional MerR regulator